jgi:hypothetical protein
MSHVNALAALGTELQCSMTYLCHNAVSAITQRPPRAVRVQTPVKGACTKWGAGFGYMDRRRASVGKRTSSVQLRKWPRRSGSLVQRLCRSQFERKFTAVVHRVPFWQPRGCFVKDNSSTSKANRDDNVSVETQRHGALLGCGVMCCHKNRSRFWHVRRRWPAHHRTLATESARRSEKDVTLTLSALR